MAVGSLFVVVVGAAVVVRKNIFRIPLKKLDLADVVTGGDTVVELLVNVACVERIKLCPISAFAYDNCWQAKNRRKIEFSF